MKLFLSVFFVISINTASLAQTYSLDHYLEVAQKNSPLLKDMRNQVGMSKLDSLRLRAGNNFQVNASSAGLFAPVTNGYGYAGAITNVQTFNALLGVSKTIIGRGNLNSQYAAIQLQRDSLIAAARISEQDLRKSIIAQYITAYGSSQQLKFNQETIDLLNQEEVLLKKLTRANVYRQTDYLAFLVTLKQQQLQLLQASLQFKNDYATLNYLAGIADTSMARLSEPMIEKTYAPPIANSIYYQKFRLDSLRLTNSSRLIDYAYKPKVNVFGDAGFNTDFTGQEYKNFGTSVGFNIIVPIYDGGQRKLQHRRLEFEENSRQNYKTFFEVQYRQQIAQLNQQILESDKILEKVNEQIKFTESLIKVDTQLLQTGDLKIADLILAVNNYLTAKNLLTQTTISRLQLINQLNYWNK
ncbi:TolC family protein [Mucilaginibacter sp. UR6-11]|uniref:TolC family protein n=1 Tax=Mucilaginibacter sp. UR6-11 TaxID=1435644 RepID=UPI001E30295C|nr:TolC family protein [Mucilaginibacter sp. UR6-11]MCC8425637.1 TolC family protein [Mucilaginibacter sp. UR6-11]